ncbi:extracellular solute-binding protein [Chloroflexales bacterium ZM16-3]|nr:extracellular solute-binding protein [Chloroflexales bacterium ZM16-3]
MNTTLPTRAARLLGTALVIIMAVACAGPPAPPAPVADAPTPTAAPSASPIRPTATARPTPSPTPPPRLLLLWVSEVDANLEAVRALAADYQRTSGVQIDLAAKSPDTLRLSVAGVVLTGEPPPDLIWADQEALAGLLADGQIQPTQATGDPLPGLLEDATTEGKLWGVPLTAQGTLLLLYNRQIATGPPETSDDLIVRSRAGGAGLVMAWDEPRWLLPWLYGFGGAITNSAGDTPTLDTPEMVSALGLLRELAAASPAEVKTYRGGQRWFGQGEVAFAVDGDWALPEYRTLTETLDLGVAPMPVVPATGQRALPVIGGTFLMLHRDLGGEDLARAKAFAAFLERPETQARLALALGRLPASRQVLDDPAIRSDPALTSAAAMAANAPGLPPTKASRCALFGIDVWLPSLLGGKLNQAETATNMQREAEACVTQ